MHDLKIVSNFTYQKAFLSKEEYFRFLPKIAIYSFW